MNLNNNNSNNSNSVNNNNNNNNKNKNNRNNNEEKVVEFDVNGNEICFLFRKFGKCRFGLKCKKSHDLNGPVGEHSSISGGNNSNNERQQQPIHQINKNNTCYKIKQIFNSCEEEYKKTIIPLERTMILNGMKMDNKSKKLLLPSTSTSSTTLVNNKIELKRIKRNHFNLYKIIKDNLLKYPFIYNKPINSKQQINNIDFSRFRPFVFLLLKSVLKLDFQNKWLVTVGNSLISLIKEQPVINKRKSKFNNIVSNSNVGSNLPYPVILERRLIEWGINEINSRKIIVLIWKNLLLSQNNVKTKISPLIIKCEKEVRNKDIDSLDYANSCITTANFTRYSNSNLLLQKQQQQQQQQHQEQPLKNNKNNNSTNWKDIKRRELEEFQLSLNQNNKS